MKRLFFFFIAALFVWGIALRSVELINGNYLFGHDHGRDYLAAYSIVEHHKLTLIGAEVGSGVAGINGIFHGPGYFYLIALAYTLFRGDPIGGQLFMVLFGVLAMAAAAWIGYKMFGKLGSIVLLFFVTVSPLVVSQSRFIWSSHPITVFVLLALYLVYKIPDNPRLMAPLAVFVAGFSYHSQLGVAAPLTVGVMLAIPLVYRITDWKTYLYSFLALCLAYSPMIAFDMRHGFMGAQSIISYASHGTGGNGMFDPLRLSSHLTNYWDNFTNTYTFEFGWIPNNIQMIVLWMTFPVVIFGLLFTKLQKKQKLFVRSLVLISVVTYIAFLLLNNVVWDYYLTHTRIGYMLLYTIAFVSLLRSRRRSLLVNSCLGVIGVFLIALIVGSVFRQYVSYTVDIHDLGVYDKILGKRQVIDEIYTDAGGQPFSVFVFMPSIYTYPYDYLFKTYGKNAFGYEPGHDKKGLAYLIIEPDRSQPWRANGWLETVVQGGQTVWKKTLLNGLILEKREYPL